MSSCRGWFTGLALIVLAAACGDDPAKEVGGDNASDANPAADVEPDSADADQPATSSSDGGGSATITIGDSTVLFSMNDLTFSQVDGIDDTTFETCDPSFFGAAFRAIGYPVDESGELVLDADGSLAGILALTLPVDADGEEVAGPAEFDLDYSPLDLDLKIASDEQLASMATDVVPEWSFDENRVSGTAVMGNVLSEPTVIEFDITCS